ncbi:MAG: response regulator transcription factor [Muribaculaceae bacterium]
MNILIIEDEFELMESIASYLKAEGYHTEYACNCALAYEKLDLYQYDCVIVDITLPDGNGLDLIKHLKSKNNSTGVIIVSARNAINDKILGLDIGADDYLAKPFNLSELNARIKSVIRRRCFDGCNEYLFHEIRINMDSRKIFIHEQELILTRKEYDLIFFLFMNKERVLTKEMIVEHLWGDMMGVSSDSFDFIYTHVRNVRKKMMDLGAKDYIKTIYGVGYKLTDL